MEYSNTGYVLSGIIIARETGKTYAAHLRERIFAPLGMKDTWVATHEAFPIEREARGYMHVDPDKKPQWDIQGAGDPVDGVWDSTEWFPMSGANAAGDMVSTPKDIVTFLNALFDGKILGPRQVGEMKDNLRPAQFPGSKVVCQRPRHARLALWRHRRQGAPGPRSPAIPASWAMTKRPASPPC